MDKILPIVDPTYHSLKKIAVTLRHLASQKDPEAGKILMAYATGIDNVLGDFSRSMAKISEQHSIFAKQAADARGPAQDSTHEEIFEFESPRRPK